MRRNIGLIRKVKLHDYIHSYSKLFRMVSPVIIQFTLLKIHL